MIEVQGISKRYNSTLAVDALSFHVSRGEVVGFLGPNGAGKTTTLRIITGYMAPTSGTVHVGGYDVNDYPLEIHRQIGYLPENNPLYEDIGVIEFLDFIARLRDIPPDKMKSRLKEVVLLCGLEGVMKKNIGELSRGYKQRLGFAQAIISDPPILIMDEPTTGLDPNQIIEIRELIKELGKEKTVIISTHILSEVQAVCERVLIINQGRLVADGKQEELHKMIEGRERISLQLRQGPDKVLGRLEKLPGIERVRVREEGKDFYGYEIQALKGTDVREDLFRFAVKENWTVLELHKETASLEDVFRELTKEE